MAHHLNESIGLEYANQYYKIFKENGYYVIDEGMDVAGALIIPEAPSGDFVLVRQHRVPISKDCYEFPRGGRRGLSEPVDEAARRELGEETGYLADSLEFLGIIHPNSAILRTGVAVFHAKIKDYTEVQTDGEVDGIIYASKRRLSEMIASNEITDAMTLSAFSMLFTRQLSR